MRIILTLAALTFFILNHHALAVEAASPKPGQVLVTGTVPDEASKANILNKLRGLYGADKVVDQITIAPVVLPANWNKHVGDIIDYNLQLVNKGELKVDGTYVTIRGEVDNEATRQKIASDMVAKLNANYTIKNGLAVTANEQIDFDKILAGRTIEFNLGNAVLTPKGVAILDELLPPLLKLKNKKLEIIGHTDNTGLHSSNVTLSKARADAVQSYLVRKGMNNAEISTYGGGDSQPIASNDTPEGRAKNRRIEFRIVK